MTGPAAATPACGRRSVVLTRPASDAPAWAQALQQAGFVVDQLPLVAFAAAADPLALSRARQGLASVQAVWCVSPQAVQAFFNEKEDSSHTSKASFAIDLPTSSARQSNALPRFWAPGPGTAQALRRCGVPADRIDQPPAAAAQFDSEALWPVVSHQVQPGCRVMVVRGADGAASRESGSGREWLLDRIRQQGGQVWPVVAYERVRPSWTDAECALARRRATDGAVWLFTSSDGVRALPALLPQQQWQQAVALVTHPRVGDAARALGMREVAVCRPALPDVLAALHDAALKGPCP